MAIKAKLTGDGQMKEFLKKERKKREKRGNVNDYE